MTEASLETPLAERDAAMLDFEERWFTLDVPKEQAIMERFGCSTTRYYQRLNNLIDDPAALGYKPLLVKRLRRQRAQRQAASTPETRPPLTSHVVRRESVASPAALAPSRPSSRTSRQAVRAGLGSDGRRAGLVFYPEWSFALLGVEC